MHRRRQRALVWMKIAFVALSLLVALGTVLPQYAKLVAGPPAHVCHCEVSSERAGGTGHGHAHCACPICFPELAADLDLVISQAVKGRCGDDDTGWRTLSDPAVLSAQLGVFAPWVDDRGIELTFERPHDPIDPPEPRPPRA